MYRRVNLLFIVPVLCVLPLRVEALPVTPGDILVGVSDGVGHIDPDTGIPTILTSGGFISGASEGIAVAPNGAIFVAEASPGGVPVGGAVIEIDPLLGAQSLVSLDDTLRFNGIAIEANGDILVGVGDGVARIDPGTGIPTILTLGGFISGAPEGIAVAPNGAIFVAEVSPGGIPVGGAVIEIDPLSGAQSLVSLDDTLRFNGIAIEANGDILVGVGDGVARIDPGTGIPTILTLGGFISGAPEGIAVAPNGAIFVAEVSPGGVPVGGAVIEIDPLSGAQSLVSLDDTLRFNGIAIVPVPEPASLLLLAVALLSLIAVRRPDCS